MLEGFSLGNYLLLVEYTGRRFRDGKAVISAELSEILERIGSAAETWWARIDKLSKGRRLGRFFAAGRARLREVAARMGRAPSGRGRLAISSLIFMPNSGILSPWTKRYRTCR